jgi:hypothetical protein
LITHVTLANRKRITFLVGSRKKHRHTSYLSIYVVSLWNKWVFYC